MIGGVLANQIAVNAVWFACAFGASTGRPWLGALAALTWVAFYLGQSLRPRSEAILVIAAGLTGLVCDAVLVGAGALSYAGQPLAPWQAPAAQPGCNQSPLALASRRSRMPTGCLGEEKFD